MAQAQPAKEFLNTLFQIAVHAADPMKVLAGYLPPRPKGRLLVIGAGKASARMAEATHAHYGDCEGLVITRHDHARPSGDIKIIEAAHPVPDNAGLQATQQIWERTADLGADDLVIALISGGGSSLLCAPAKGLTLADKMQVNEILLASGLPIGEMNVIRQCLSAVKGGRLAAHIHPARVVNLLISDVPGDYPNLIASGPTVQSTASAQDALNIIEKHQLSLPASILQVLKNATFPRLSHNIETHIIAAPSQSLHAAAQHAINNGYDVQILGDALEGEARTLAAQHANMALELQAQQSSKTGRPILLLSSGECTVTKRGAGVGGPNAEYVLATILALGGAAGIHVISCDTDGIDGAAPVAGAYGGPKALAKAKALGLCPQTALDQNDAHSFFAKLDAQIITGPTFTNVNDFRAILIERCA